MKRQNQDDQLRWDAAASAYDVVMGSQGDNLKKYVVDPVLFYLLGEIKNKNILDAGCGNGYLLSQLIKKGAKVSGVDFSQKMISIAKSKCKQGKFLLADLSKHLPFPNQSFDIVIAHFVFMDLPNLSAALNECERVLNKKGIMVFSVLHPCFSPPAVYIKRGLIGRLIPGKFFLKIKNYFAKGSTLISIGKSSPPTRVYHRSLEEYFSVLRQSGFIVTDFREPACNTNLIKKFPKLKPFTLVPVVAIFKAKKNKKTKKLI
jgi:ubiquinone/menaquinone biosynthesis C-methylase UbiE